MSVFSSIFRIRGSMPSWCGWVLPIVPIAIALALYLNAAQQRRAENPSDKLMPLPADFYKAVVASVTLNEFTEEIPLVEDLKSSLLIFSIGFGAAVVFSLVVGLHVGAW